MARSSSKSYVGRTVVDDNLDAIGAIAESLANRLPGPVWTTDRHVLLLDDLLRLRNETPELAARRGERARARHNSRSRKPAAIDRIAQR
jgi:hypothetical protein